MKPVSLDSEIADILLKAQNKAQTEEILHDQENSTLDCQFRVSNCRRLFMRIRILEGYPANPVIVEMTSNSLRQKLLDKLKKQAETKSKEAAEKNEAQIKMLYEWVCSLLYDSRFLLCWDEILKTKKQVLSQKKDELKSSDKTGIITVKSQEGKYECLFQVEVPFTYPAEQPVLKIKKTNLKEQIYQGYVIQANQIGKRCKLGYPPGYGKEGFKKNRKYFDGTLKKIQQEIEDKYKGKMTRSEVKHDVEFLRQQNDYKGRQNEKQARYNLKKMVAKEKEKEIQKLEEIKEEEKEAFAAVGRAQGEQKSLFAMLDYFLNYFFHKVPSQNCKICNRLLLTEKHELQKAYCGHWFHLNCLEESMNEPPFDKQCPVSSIITVRKKSATNSWDPHYFQLIKQLRRTENGCGG